MRSTIAIVVAAIFVGCSVPPLSADGGVRVKDIAHIAGARTNQLMGYGLAVGLDGTGDSKQAIFTPQSVANMLLEYGINVPAGLIRVKNVAAVMVSTELPPFAKPGDRIDVTVSSIGDASSLQGGTLLQTPLLGADSKVYAVAQGPISIGGFVAQAGGTQVQKNHQTVGRVPGGALVENIVPATLDRDGVVSISLSDADFATASRIASAVNADLGQALASAPDGGTVLVRIPQERAADLVGFIADIGQVRVRPDTVAKVIINERTGTVIIGGNVTISPVAVSHGGLTVEITQELLVSQPPPLAPKTGKTEIVPQNQVQAREEPGALRPVAGRTVQELVRSLNAIKVTPRDIIAILQAIKQAGALQAELEII